jgi:hypothetical protein
MKINRINHILGGFFVLLSVSIICSANPIPVYPNPEPTLISAGTSESFPGLWLGVIFIINFCVDILILYGGLLVLDSFQVLPEEYVFNLSKIVFFVAVGLISFTGLIVEYFLGAWFGGLLLAALVILCSFVFIGRWLLRISWGNGIRLGSFALTINIIMWIIFYSIF